MNDTIGFEDFKKVDIRVGTVTEAYDNIKAHKPAYILKIDFGESIGIKTSSAQITECCAKDSLIGKQVMAVMNFEVKRIAGVKSEVLVLGCVHPKINVVLMQPSQKVPDGTRVL